MGLFDWLSRRRQSESAPPVDWPVQRESGEFVAEHGRGASIRAPIFGGAGRTARAAHHRDTRAGWQVTFSRPEGDVLVRKPLADWRSAHKLAQVVCETVELPLDGLTEKMFSRVGQYTPAREA